MYDPIGRVKLELKFSARAQIDGAHDHLAMQPGRALPQIAEHELQTAIVGEGRSDVFEGSDGH